MRRKDHLHILWIFLLLRPLAYGVGVMCKISNRSLTSGLFTNVNCAYMSNKLDKTGCLSYLRRRTVLFKNNSAWCAGRARGLKNAAEQLKIPLRGSDT